MSKSITIAKSDYDGINLIKYFDIMICNKSTFLNSLIDTLVDADNINDINDFKTKLYNSIKDNIEFGYDVYPYIFIGHDKYSKYLYITQYSNVQNIHFIYKYEITFIQEDSNLIILKLIDFDISVLN